MEPLPRGPLPPVLKGTTPLPVWSIPTALQPAQAGQRATQPSASSTSAHQAESKSSLVLAAFTWFYLLRTILFLYCALTIWGAPESGSTAWLTEHSGVILKMIPRGFSPMTATAVARAGEVSYDAEQLHTILLMTFSVLGLYSGVAWWMFLNRNSRIRWALMCSSGYAMFRIAMYLVLHSASGIPLGDSQVQFMLLNFLVSFVIFGFMTFDPKITNEFESND